MRKQSCLSTVNVSCYLLTAVEFHSVYTSLALVLSGNVKLLATLPFHPTQFTENVTSKPADIAYKTKTNLLFSCTVVYPVIMSQKQQMIK